MSVASVAAVIAAKNSRGASMSRPRLVVHGGLDTPDTPEVREALARALEAGWDALPGADPVTAAAAAVRVLEDDPRFNAGSGGLPTDTGVVELDAGVSAGWTGRFAGIAALRDVANPVLVAAELLARRPDVVLLAGEGASRFAREVGFPRRPPAAGGPEVPDTETVGCIARAVDGRVAAASSTGGVRDQPLGRVGDTPVPGAGIWADGRFAVLCSGQGEHALRRALAVRTALAAARVGAAAAADDAVGDAAGRDDAPTGIVVYDAVRDEVVARATRAPFLVMTRDADGLRVVELP